MIYNAQRRRVTAVGDKGPSTCPDCEETLVARRGEWRIWHWAHLPSSGWRPCEGAVETTWHLAWKLAYDGFRNWTIEEQFRGLRIDAMNRHTGCVREFIHSLSPRYIEKHRALQASGCDVWWVIDGEQFASRRRRYTRDGKGMRSPVTPRVYALFAELDRRCWIHADGYMWHEWKDNVWYPHSDQTMVYRFDCMTDKLTAEQPDGQAEGAACQ